MQQLITERLERYTDLDRATIASVVKQTLIALDLEDVHEPVTMSRAELEDAEDRAYDRGHYEGRKDGADLMIARLLHDGIIEDGAELAAYASMRLMFKDS